MWQFYRRSNKATAVVVLLHDIADIQFRFARHSKVVRAFTDITFPENTLEGCFRGSL